MSLNHWQPKAKNIPKKLNEYVQRSSSWSINHSPTEVLQPWQIIFKQIALLLLALPRTTPASQSSVRWGSPAPTLEHVGDAPQRYVLAHSPCPDPPLPSQVVAVQAWNSGVPLLLLAVCCGSRHHGWESHLYRCPAVQFLVGQGAQRKSCHPTWLSSLSCLAPTAEAKDWGSTGDESCSESLQVGLEACWKSDARCLHGPVLWVKKGIMISWG